MWQHIFCVSVMCSALRRELQLTPQRRTQLKQLNEEVKDRIPDDDLERSKHEGLFLIKVF